MDIEELNDIFLGIKEGQGWPKQFHWNYQNIVRIEMETYPYYSDKNFVSDSHI